MPRAPIRSSCAAIAAGALLACTPEAAPPPGARPAAAEPLRLPPASAAAPIASSAPASSAKPGLEEISAPTVEEAESREEQCKPEILARDLYAPGWLLTTDDGHAYAVEIETLKKGKDYSHRTRIYDLAGSRAKLLTDIEARINHATLVGNEIVLTDYGADQLVRVPLDTRKPVREPPRPDAIARSADGALLRAKVSPEQLQLVSPSATVAVLPGAWDPDRIEIAASATHVYLQAFPGDISPGSPEWSKARLARAPIGGDVELLGTKHLAGTLATGGGFLFAGSLGSMLRMNERTAEWQRAPNGGAETIVADKQGAAWTEGEHGTVMYWPHGGAPFLACSAIPGAAGITMNEKYVYFSAYGADLTAGGATIGRFPRPR